MARPPIELFGQQHVEAYQATDGEVGHEWLPGVHTLLLTTTGRRTGESYTTPLIYTTDGDDYVVIASKGGAPQHPDWYLNLSAVPEVEVQIGDEVRRATARDATGERREQLWSQMAQVWPDYDRYAEQTDREIPVVVLTPTD
jgi:deazaflavin-dependent oxidoreductase (nitroreductase family)